MEDLYKNWARSCMPLAIFTLVILLSSLRQIGWAVFIIWLQFPVYLIHEFREHVSPGDFKNFINTNVFKSKRENFPLNDANIYWINIPFIWIIFPLFAVLAQNVNIEFGVVLPIFSIFNATTHIIMTLVKRRFNPGVIASIFLNYPAGIYALYYLLHNNLFSASACWLGLVFALLSHLGMIVFALQKIKRG